MTGPAAHPPEFVASQRGLVAQGRLEERRTPVETPYPFEAGIGGVPS